MLRKCRAPHVASSLQEKFKYDAGIKKRMTKRFGSTISIIVALLLVMSMASAKGVVQIDDEIQDYFVSVSYSPDKIRAGEPVAFSIAFLDKNTREQAPFDYVWVRISDAKEERIFSAGEYTKESAADKDVDFVYTFQKSGQYQLYLRFHKGKTLVHQAVYIPVGMSREEKIMWTAIVIALLLLAYSLYWAKHHYHLVREKRRKKEQKK